MLSPTVQQYEDCVKGELGIENSDPPIEYVFDQATTIRTYVEDCSVRRWNLKYGLDKDYLKWTGFRHKEGLS